MMGEVRGGKGSGTAMSQMGLRVCWGTRPLPCPVPSISLVEPGPVGTAFEGKLLEQVSAAQFPGADPDTLHYFRDLYLPASRELFRSLGQSPRDVAQVSRGLQDAVYVCRGPSLQNCGPWVPELRAPPHRLLSRSSARPDHPCADRPTPATPP